MQDIFIADGTILDDTSKHNGVENLWLETKKNVTEYLNKYDACLEIIQFYIFDMLLIS